MWTCLICNNEAFAWTAARSVSEALDAYRYGKGYGKAASTISISFTSFQDFSIRFEKCCCVAAFSFGCWKYEIELC
jgi:hypothetical protein